MSTKGKQTDGVLSMSTGQHQWPRREITEGKKKKKHFSTNAEAKLTANNSPIPLHSKYSAQVAFYIVTPLRFIQEQLRLMKKVNQVLISLISV